MRYSMMNLGSRLDDLELQAPLAKGLLRKLSLAEAPPKRSSIEPSIACCLFRANVRFQPRHPFISFDSTLRFVVSTGADSRAAS